MEQEVNQKLLDESIQEKRHLKHIILALFVSITLIYIGLVYIVLNNSQSEKPNQPQNQIVESEDDLIEKRVSEENEPENNENNRAYLYINNSSVTSCEFWKDKIFSNVETMYGEDLAGTAIIKGFIKEQVQNAAWAEGEKVTIVYLVLSEPLGSQEQLFYDHYFKMAKRGNAINRVNQDQLYIRLGAKEDDQLITTADISIETKDRILSLIDTTNTIQLNLTIPIYPGSSVGDSSSFACFISE